MVTVDVWCDRIALVFLCFVLASVWSLDVPYEGRVARGHRSTDVIVGEVRIKIILYGILCPICDCVLCGFDIGAYSQG